MIVMPSVDPQTGDSNIVSRFEWHEGYVVPFTAPGLGTEIDESVARAHPWSGGRLHLEMGRDTDDWPG